MLCAMECCGSFGPPCHGCGKQIRKGREATCRSAVGGCGKVFCSLCCSYALVPASEESKGKDAEFSLYCKPCFKANNLLDFSTTVDVFGPACGAAPCILFVHGMLNCRSSFRVHARQLSERDGFRCVLLDLPGHGARMDEDLSIASALDAIESAVKTYCTDAGGMPTFILGMSLGGFLAMEMLGRSPDLFAGAILVECNFNLGVGRSLKNKMRLWAMQKAFGCVAYMSNAQVLEYFWKAWKGGGHISTEILMTALMRTGVFPRPVPACATIAGCVDLLAGLRLFRGPVLFMQVSKGDEDIFVGATERGRLKYVEGGDHQYPVDDRFMQGFINDIASFVREVAAQATP